MPGARGRKRRDYRSENDLTRTIIVDLEAFEDIPDKEDRDLSGEF